MSDDDDSQRPHAFTDKLKKALSAGIGAILFTEESVRNYVKESKLPRDIASYVMQNANRGKDELVSYLAKELNTMLTRMDLTRELEKILTRHTIRVRADIELVPRDPDDPEGRPATIEWIARDDGEAAADPG